jgi:hypothetical protein
MSDIVRDPYGNPLKRDATITALRAENEKLRAALKKINVGDGWAALIARAALELPNGTDQ